MLLAASSLIASFLGSEALGRGGLTLVAWLAIGAFVASLLATLYVLIPKLSLTFVVDARQLRRSLADEPNSSEINSALVRLSQRLRRSNGSVIRQLYGIYLLAAVSVTLQVALWVVQLAATM